MIEALPVRDALYPVLVIKGEPPEILVSCIKGISYKIHRREDGVFTVFPFWHYEHLVRFFGDATRDFSKQVLDNLRNQRQSIEDIKSGKSPVLQQVPQAVFNHKRQIWEPYYEHQRVGIAMCLAAKTFGLFYEPGLGKTAIMAEIMRMRRRGTLVMCPVTLVRGAWIKELQARAPELRIANLYEEPELMNYHFDVYILNPQKLIRRPNEFRMALLPKIQRVIIDESSMMKNPQSKIAQTLLSDYSTVEERYLLSGTPAPNGPEEYWTQLTFLRPGLLPLTYEEYMNTWFVEKYHGKFKPKIGAIEEITNRISSCTIFKSKKDCTDIPEKNFVPRYITLPDDKDNNIRKAYDNLKWQLQQEIIKLQENDKRGGGMFAKIMKLREITSGFIVTKDQHNPDKQVWNFVSKHKIDALEELLEEIGNKQVVIWMNFVKDFEVFHNHLPQYSSRSGYIYGEVKDPTVRQQVIENFLAGRIQYLLANPASLGHGVTLINQDNPCSDSIYYDFDYSLERFEQSQDRIHRIGQRNVVNYYALMCEDTIDEEIWERLKNKKLDLSNALELLK